MSTTNIALLLQAAEYVERKDREAEHGYASTLPMPDDYSRRKAAKSRKFHGNRSTHNELEKNRRAQLRHCLERLKEMVPVGSDASRHTTLGLLTKAKNFIKILEDKERKQQAAREKLNMEQRYLRRRLDNLTDKQYRTRVERSISECSSSTVSTTSGASESDEVDIVGFDGSSSPSDTDDQSSIQSSDGGCSYNTRQLTLSDDSL